MKTRITVLTMLVTASLAASLPFAALAKDNGKGKSDHDSDDNRGPKITITKNEKLDDNCFRAFGHLIAPGWIKHNGQVDIGTECHLPFGIGKKFQGNNASSTPDVTAPVLSAIIVKPALHQAEIRWTTDEKSDSTAFWSTTTPVSTDASNPNRVSQNGLTKDHRLVIRHLAPSTTYYATVRSIDAAGNASLSGVVSFTTTAPAADTKAPVISNIVTLSATTSIEVGWKTNENATGRVYYSTALPVNLSTAPFVDTAALSTDHLSTITGLNPSTVYYLVAESTDGSGNVSTSATFTATTLAGTTTDTTAPVVSNLVTSVGSTTATVNWTTDEFATSKLFYSTSTPVDTTSSATSLASNLSLSLNHSLTVSGLATSTLYHFVVQSADASSNTASTAEFSTTTLAN